MVVTKKFNNELELMVGPPGIIIATPSNYYTVSWDDLDRMKRNLDAVTR